MKTEFSLSEKPSSGHGVAGVVLAAGASIRMGRPKQLLQIGENSLIVRILQEALSSELEKVVVVLGHRAEEIAAVLGDCLAHPKIVLVENPEYQKGISTSIRAGLKMAEEQGDHVMFLLADMPYIDKELMNKLMKGYLDSKSSMGAVSIKGRRTHPVIFGRKWYGELHRLKGDMGARELFVGHPDDVYLFEAGEHFSDVDIDTPEDYERFRSAQTARDD